MCEACMPEKKCKQCGCPLKPDQYQFCSDKCWDEWVDKSH